MDTHPLAEETPQRGAGARPDGRSAAQLPCAAHSSGAGRFEYRALLPADVKADEIKATLADRVLAVTVPKAQAAKPRRIEITPA
ncbi:Hsp20/alpha crystallin family protein [Streptomyces lydicus]|uniref:Hsp20/alpha crystallin family protein n=1 Tax=Streptomyces lydicus TaxID=47763 RepID=UPI00321FD74A